MGCGVVEGHLEIAQPKKSSKLHPTNVVRQKIIPMTALAHSMLMGLIKTNDCLALNDSFTRKQCDQQFNATRAVWPVWAFLKLLASKFAFKRSLKHFMTIWDILKRSTYVKTAVAYIWATFGKIWLYFPKSGLTGLHICVNYSIFGNLQQ